jgi:hypothetical protein
VKVLDSKVRYLAGGLDWITVALNNMCWLQLFEYWVTVDLREHWNDTLVSVKGD